jgi:CRISPR-associated protein Csb2
VPTLKLRFPGGRYHATPWGHHVNEGLIEWPPCPWRLLRALIACGFSSQGWTEVPTHARQLINTLAGVLPSYRLPSASAAHSRHFMPVGSFRKPSDKKSITEFVFSATGTQRADIGNYYTEDTTLVYDTWANVGDGELLIHWPCDLHEDENALLGRLATSLGYLGRSESWVEAELVAGNQEPPAGLNAFPHRDGWHPGREHEQVTLMAAIPPEEYRAWHHQTTAPILEAIQLSERSRKPTARQLEKLQAQRTQAIDPYPPDVLSCLTKDTAWWKQRGWSQPPGSQRVLYWRRSDSLQVGVPQRRSPGRLSPVTTMLLALTTPSGNRSALPPCDRTLPQAELFHRAIVGRVGRGRQVHCPELTGKDEHGRPLHIHHGHAHTIPVDLDGDGHLDHLVVYASMGLGDAAQRAVRTLRRTWTKGGVGDIQVAVAGHGDLEMLRQLPSPLDRPIVQLLGPPEGARVWESATPFVLPRFLKPSGKNTLVGQVNAELASRGLPDAESVLVDADLTRALRHHVRRRQHGGVPPPVDEGYGLRLVFSEPVHGPLLLGYASHYGLGVFRARRDADFA